jgi:tRNA(His) 5'-end guanylyltransferase
MKTDEKGRPLTYWGGLDKSKKQTTVEWLETRAEEREKNNPNESAYWHLRELIKDFEQAKEMEKEQQGKFTIDFINWLHLNEYKYNAKAKLYQKHFINETLFFSIDELFITFKQQDQGYH